MVKSSSVGGSVVKQLLPTRGASKIPYAAWRAGFFGSVRAKAFVRRPFSFIAAEERGCDKHIHYPTGIKRLEE